MRFNTSNFFKIDELILDQDNYRFGLADSQEECIELIYKDSPASFENLLDDLIKNNIGDYPLVFINEKNENIVLDGNRRVSILKIINDPSLAPSKKIADIVNNIDKKDLPFDLEKISCFVSKDKNKILKTVYERHAAGKGISRIHWSAFATAKFRYDSKINDNDWRAIAILLHVISINNDIDILVKSPKFSFEVFKRLIRHAYLNNYIHFDIFNEEKIILNPESLYFDSAINLIEEFIKLISNNEVGLSRGKNYASENFLTELFTFKFTKITTQKPPRTKRKKNQEKEALPDQIEDSPEPDQIQASEEIDHIQDLQESGQIQASEEIDHIQGRQEPDQIQGREEPQHPLPFIDPRPKLEITEAASLIENNIDLINALNKLSVQKYSLLYQSLTQLNIKKHAIVAVVTVWSFLDSLPRLANWSGTDFTGYYGNHIKSLIVAREQQSAIRHSLNWLSNEGNCNKHNGQYVTLDHKEFIKHFNIIQPFLAKCIVDIIIPNKK